MADDRLEYELSLNFDKMIASVKKGEASLDDFDAILNTVKNSLTGIEAESADALSKFKTEIGDASKFAKDFRTQVDLAKAELTRMTQAGVSAGDALAGLKRFSSLTGAFSPQAISQATKEMDIFKTKVRETSSEMSGLDKISTIFFGTTLANLAVNALRRVIGQLDELAKRGVDVSKSFFNMGVTVRALQRLGLDITLAEWEEQVQKITTTFDFFTQRSVRAGISQMALLIRNVKLSKEELFALSEVVGTIAITTGRDFEETAIGVGRAINSGYTEALQNAGIAVSRFDIQQAAAKRGIDKAFNAMSSQERAATTLQIVLDQVADVTEDVAQAELSLYGQSVKATTAIEEQADALGTKLTPVYVFFLTSISRAFEGFVAAIGLTQAYFFFFISQIVGGTAAIVAAFESMKNGVAISLDEFVRIQKDTAQELLQIWTDEFIIGSENIFADSPIGGLPPAIEEDGNEAIDELNDIKDKINAILRTFNTGLVEGEIDLIRSNQDINLRFDRRGADEELELIQAKEKLERQTQDKLADARVKFNEKELKAERDFQEKLQRLREKFLFDLEDALRERDAKQVLRLIRSFNLQQDQLKREEDNASKERQEGYQSELADIQAQKERKLRELQIEHEERLAELSLQRDREREDALKNYFRDKEDLKRHMGDRLAALKEGLSAEYQTYVDYYSGVITLAQAGAIAIATFMRSLYGTTLGTGLPGFGGGGSPGYGGAKTYAEGGTVVARKPTLAIFGERGPEVANFTPLGRVGQNVGKVYGGSLPGGSGGGKMSIEILLGPDLEHRIIDQTLGEVGDIIVRRIG